MSEQEKSENSNNLPKEDKIDLAFSLAGSLIWIDRRFIALLYPLLIIPEFLNTYNQNNPDLALPLQLVQRFLLLLCLFIIAIRWIERFSITPKGNYFKLLTKLIAYGFGIWLIVALPIALLMAGPPELQGVIFLTLLPAIYIELKYYFYFFPILCGASSIREVIGETRIFTEKNLTLPIKLIISPAAIMLILTALCQTLDPDGRSIFIAYITDICSGIMILLSSYLAIATCLSTAPNRLWTKYNLDPYRQARFSTLLIQGPKWPGVILRPKNGLIILALGLLIWTANEMRAAKMIPAPQIALDSVQYEDNKVNIRLSLFDRKYHFRGFNPGLFHLAGARGAPVAKHSTSILIDNTEFNPLLPLQIDQESIEVDLEFKTDLNKDELKKLEDLSLWYRQALIFNLN